MPTWFLYAVLSAVFAGVTAVIAKKGLTGISGDLGLVVRTLMVAVMALIFAWWFVPTKSLKDLNRDNLMWLGLSAAATLLSWVFYYRALKLGNVSTVALVDKGSIVVSLVLAALILKETITLRTGLGGLLVLAGILVISRK